MLRVFQIVAIIALPLFVFMKTAWWDTLWLNRERITFDNTASAEDLASFPILIRLTSSNIDFTKIKALGADIRFLDSNNRTELDYEIENWNDGASTAEVWVRVPQIDSGSTTDHIFIYFNNAAATDDQDPNAVWDANYVGVYHLEETGSADHVDSTGTNIDATRDGNTAGAGQIDGGQDFDGTNDDIDLLGIENDIDVDTGTVSAWLELDVSATTSVLFNGQVDLNNNIAMQWLFDDTGMRMKYEAGGTVSEVIIPDTEIDEGDGKKHYLVLTWDTGDDEVKVFIAGAQNGSTQTTLGTWVGAMAGASLGFNIVQGVGNLPGMIDEFRASIIARSPDWIEACWLNQKDSSTFNTFGPEENVH